MQMMEGKAEMVVLKRGWGDQVLVAGLIWASWLPPCSVVYSWNGARRLSSSKCMELALQCLINVRG